MVRGCKVVGVVATPPVLIERVFPAMMEFLLKSTDSAVLQVRGVCLCVLYAGERGYVCVCYMKVKGGMFVCAIWRWKGYVCVYCMDLIWSNGMISCLVVVVAWGIQESHSRGLLVCWNISTIGKVAAVADGRGMWCGSGQVMVWGLLVGIAWVP